MKNSPTSKWLKELRASYPDVELLPPAGTEAIQEAERVVGPLPEELAEFLAHSNGLVARSFRLLSALDRSHVKKTWESLQRANEAGKTEALGGDQQLLSRFLVFADIGNGFGSIDRTDGSIWYQESNDGELHRTNLSFNDFIETMIKNAE